MLQMQFHIPGQMQPKINNFTKREKCRKMPKFNRSTSIK